ncbi:hypothetical protein [Hahella sp. NBU794]|uniref:hypothetical protein n=1 Tax=Hahella sp. NBU794 TaxID=3422590 RepID=UPI003D6E43F8
MLDIDIYRHNEKRWSDLAYAEGTSAEGDSYDLNEKPRYAAMLALQYDLKNSDETLVRFLFEQEILARENDDYQGIGEALPLGAYLLASFKRPGDIPLFYDAKFANFDTACGFDREYMYVALGENTESYVLEHYPDLHEEIIDFFDKGRMESWWNRQVLDHPQKQSDEHLMTLFRRSLYFEDLAAAREFIDEWRRAEPESSSKESTLKYAYKAIAECESATFHSQNNGDED